MAKRSSAEGLRKSKDKHQRKSGALIIKAQKNRRRLKRRMNILNKLLGK